MTACKTCKVPIHKRGDVYAADERKADAPTFTGTDRRRAAPPPPPPTPEPAPLRFHFLNRPLFGGHKQQGS